MKDLFRIVLALFVAIVAWMLMALLGSGMILMVFPRGVALVVSLIPSAVAATLVWMGTARANEELIGSIASGALIVGALGFAVGFFGGPFIWPDSNLAPLAGLSFAPVGFILGAIGGGIRWAVRRRRSS